MRELKGLDRDKKGCDSDREFKYSNRKHITVRTNNKIELILEFDPFLKNLDWGCVACAILLLVLTVICFQLEYLNSLSLKELKQANLAKAKSGFKINQN